MDATTLYQILAQANEENQAASPYAGFNDAMGQIGDASIQLGAKSGDYKTGIIGALLSGLVGGAGKSLSNSWVADQNTQAADLLNQAISGRAIARPDGMSPSVFSKVQNSGNIWGVQQKVAQQQAQQQAQQELEGKIAGKLIDAAADDPYKFQQTKESLGALLRGENVPQPLTKNGDLLSEVSKLPSGLQTQAIKEVAIAKSNEDSTAAANSAFDSALGLDSIKSAIPLTDDYTTMKNLQTTLSDVVQRQQGFEKSDKAMARLMATLPDYNDTKDQIELKRQNYLSLLSAVSDKTPLAEIVSPTQQLQQTQEQAPSAQFVIKTAPNGQRYKVRLGE